MIYQLGDINEYWQGQHNIAEAVAMQLGCLIELTSKNQSRSSGQFSPGRFFYTGFDYF